MAIISTPVGGRAMFTYPDDLPNLQINGVSPVATPAQLLGLINGISMLQVPSVRDAFLIVESDISEESEPDAG